LKATMIGSRIFQIALFAVLVCTGHCGRIKRADALKVTTIAERPHTKVDSTKTGNAAFSGFNPDLLKAIADKADFTYAIHEVEDGHYGTPLNDGQWTGLIGEILTDKATLAVAALTVTKSRELVVDFTEPIMYVSNTVLMLAATDANQKKITSVEELSKQEDIKYGCIENGSTHQFFKSTNISLYKDMLAAMEKDTSVFVKSYDEGIKKIEASKGKYAMIMENTTANFYSQSSDCKFITVGSFNPSTHAFAIKKGDSHLGAINDAIKKLKKEGEMDKLVANYWKGNTCSFSDIIRPLSFPIISMIALSISQLLL